jgi:signal transduction histidine kinase
MQRNLVLSLMLSKRTPLLNYLLALAIAIFCLALSQMSHEYLGGLRYIWPLSGSIIAAVFLGSGPALFCCAVAVLALDFLPGPAVLVRLSVVVVTTLVVSKIASEAREGYLQAEKQAAARQQIVDIVSHDVRNPLASIQMYASLLLKQFRTPSKGINEVQLVDGILRSTNRIRQITSDLLDASQKEMGRFSIKPSVENLNSIVDDTLSAFRVLAQSSHLEFEVKLFAPDVQVTADRSRLIQALSNVVHNAIKFSPEGGVVRITAEENGGQLRISVSDQGPGIPVEKMPHIFDRYWTEKSEVNLGTGLGLFISRGIATSHGGDLSVANGPAGGAVFTFTFPYKNVTKL